MISSEQENQIELYLISKKLSSQILFEVKDHFISQINNVIDAKDLNFQEAFLETKISWKRELEMVKADFFSFKKIARIEKELLQQRFRKMTVFAFLFSGVASLLLWVNPDAFTTLQIFLLVSWVVILGYSFITKKMKFSNYIIMSFHPLLVRNMLLGMVIFSFGHLLTIDYQKIWGMDLSKFFSIYSLAIQLQLLYFNSKRINVLV